MCYTTQQQAISLFCAKTTVNKKLFCRNSLNNILAQGFSPGDVISPQIVATPPGAILLHAVDL
jgi:hypothetical protein